MRHDKDIPDRPVHSVFSGNTLAQVEQAWKDIKDKGIAPYIDNSRRGNKNWIYDVRSENSGYLGGVKGAQNSNPVLNYIKIVVEPETNKVVTSYPF